jgi:2-polyprenyl-3-methyl-5-hydroxy-6-metoxy-1,4-benzoquinol methylase
MALRQDVTGTDVHPTDLADAAARHGRHFARYLFARQYATGKRVIDAACGGGYGSACLAASARSVLGLDVDEELLAVARRAFGRGNVEFRRHDLHEPIAIDQPAGLVCSFETLEHVRDPDLCLANLAACLDNDGTALVSVPNGTRELRRASDKPYHQVHFSAADFRGIIERRFERVEFRSQVIHKGPGYYLRKLTGGGRHHARDYGFAPGLDEEAKTWLAIAHDPRR